TTASSLATSPNVPKVAQSSPKRSDFPARLEADMMPRRSSLRIFRRWRLVGAALLLAPENVQSRGYNDRCSRQGKEVGDIAKHRISEHDRPDDHRVLIGDDDAGRRQFQRAVDAGERCDRNYTEKR